MLKKQVFGMIQIKNSQNEYQNQLISVLTRYEDKCQTLQKDFDCGPIDPQLFVSQSGLAQKL